jgi:hypothetical protein
VVARLRYEVLGLICQYHEDFEGELMQDAPLMDARKEF